MSESSLPLVVSVSVSIDGGGDGCGDGGGDGSGDGGGDGAGDTVSKSHSRRTWLEWQRASCGGLSFGLYRSGSSGEYSHGE